MSPVAEVFAAFDNSPTKLANATGVKVQTVSDWRAKAPVKIPEWRRPAVLEAMQDAGMPISDETRAYLERRQDTAA